MRGEWIGQAIFTSVRGERFDGYQLASHSPGLTPDDLRELARWGPAHDSLPTADPRATSINFHSLASGLHCVSKTSLSGSEYSARRGLRVYTQTLLLRPETLARFTNHAFRVLDAAMAAGRLRVLQEPPPELESFTLAGRASQVNPSHLARTVERHGPTAIAALAESIQRHGSVGVLTRDPRALFAAAIDLVPVDQRATISFSTGLCLSPQRPFRLVALSDPATQRRFARKADSLVFDPSAPPDYRPSPWAQQVLEQCSGLVTSTGQ